MIPTIFPQRRHLKAKLLHVVCWLTALNSVLLLVLSLCYDKEYLFFFVVQGCTSSKVTWDDVTLSPSEMQRETPHLLNMLMTL